MSYTIPDNVPVFRGEDHDGNELQVEVAKTLYEVYHEASGEPSPEFSELAEEDKENWRAVARFTFELLQLASLVTEDQD